MKVTKPSLLILSVLTAGLFSCNKTEITDATQLEKAVEKITSSAAPGASGGYQQTDLILGNKLTNPYLLANMTAAKNNLTAKGINSSISTNIRATHYYIKFKPQNFDQYDDLVSDTTLQLYDYPLDYEIISRGNKYRDQSIADTSIPTYQYAAVKTDFRFNDTISYEIIASLYIPEVDNSLLGANLENETYVDKLLDQAYKQTGNNGDTITVDPATNQLRPKYNPSGNIQLFDTRLNTTYGMEGVLITARRWFISYSAETNFNGDYRMSERFRRPCNYALHFSTKKFRVVHGLFRTIAWIDGPKQTDPWNHTIADGVDRFSGHIFRGGYRYYFKDIEGLQRPTRWLWRITNYVAKDQSGASGLNPIWLNNIKIWRFSTQDDNREYYSDEVFSATCHETGHTSHAIRMNTIIQFWQVIPRLQESWAVAIEWVLTHREYADRGIPNYGNENYFPPNPPLYPNDYGYQYWHNVEGNDFWYKYTNIYIDIIDNHNELGQVYQGRGTGVVDDRVSGYSLAFIESNMLKHIYGLSTLAEQLKANRPAGITDAQIDLLISQY